MYLKKIANNEPVDRIRFRKGDYFPELAENFNHAMDTLYDLRQHDFGELKKIKDYLNNLSMVLPDDKKSIIAEINKKIEDIVEHRP